jgi:hypothetical protein
MSGEFNRGLLLDFQRSQNRDRNAARTGFRRLLTTSPSRPPPGRTLVVFEDNPIDPVPPDGVAVVRHDNALLVPQGFSKLLVVPFSGQPTELFGSGQNFPALPVGTSFRVQFRVWGLAPLVKPGPRTPVQVAGIRFVLPVYDAPWRFVIRANGLTSTVDGGLLMNSDASDDFGLWEIDRIITADGTATASGSLAWDITSGPDAINSLNYSHENGKTVGWAHEPNYKLHNPATPIELGGMGLSDAERASAANLFPPAGSLEDNWKFSRIGMSAMLLSFTIIDHPQEAVGVVELIRRKISGLR